MFKDVLTNWKVWGHGFLIAVLGAMAAAAGTMFGGSALPGFNELQTLAMVGLAAGLSYLAKKVFSKGAPNGSPLLSLNIADLGYMLFQAVVSGIFLSLVTILEAHQWPTLMQIWTITLGAFGNGITYLLKNLVTNSQGKLASESSTK